MVQLKIRLLFLFWIPITFIKAQSGIYLIATQHDSSAYLTPDTLYQVLNKIKPDIILIELDSSFFTPDFEFNLNQYPKLISTNENKACYRYKLKNKVELRPYDISGRNDFYKKENYFRKEQSLYSALDSFSTHHFFSSLEQEAYDLIVFTVEQTEKIKFTSLHSLNSSEAMTLTELRQKILYENTLTIVESNPNLAQWIPFASLQKLFWEKRNQSMANQIAFFAQQYPQKKLVVFTGANHKYFLNKLLIEKQNSNYVLIDF